MVHPIATAVRADTVEAVHRFVRAGYHINVVSPQGNGNTEFLRLLRSELQELECDVVWLGHTGAAEEIPAAFLAYVSDAEAPTAPESVRALLSKWERRVGSRTCVVVCENVAVLTPTLLRLIAMARERMRVCVVVHSQLPLPSLECGGVTATVPLPVLTLDETHAVLAYRLGAPLHQGTLARIYSKAAGLIKLSLLIVDVGRIEEKLRLIDGRWIAVGDLWSYAMCAEVNAFDTHRSAEHTAAVQSLSLMGVTRLADAVDSFGVDLVHDLERSGAIAVVPTGQNHWVSVTPPLLAERDQRTMSITRLTESHSHVTPEWRSAVAAGQMQSAAAKVTLSQSDPVFLRRLTAHREQTLKKALSDWQMDPNAEHTSELIGALRPSHENADELLTLIHESRLRENPTEHLAYLKIWEAWIYGYILGDVAKTEEILRTGDNPEMLGTYAVMLRAAQIRMLGDIDRVPEDAFATLLIDDGEIPVAVRNEVHRVRAFVALVSGQPNQALAELGLVSSWAEDYFPYQHSVFYSLATVLQGDLVQARELAIRGFELALDELDERAVRMHGYVIALIARYRGDADEARVVTEVIRGLGDYPIVAQLGQKGTLVNGALATAHTLETVSAALAELSEYDGPDGVFPLTSRSLLQARHLALSGDPVAAADRCWGAACEQFERGGVVAAVISALHALDYSVTEDRIAHVAGWIALVDSEFLSSQFEYRCAVWQKDLERLAGVLPRVLGCGLLVLAREGVAEVRRLSESADALPLSESAAQQVQQVTARLALQGYDAPDVLRLDRALTTREFEVAQLLERGMTNREIQEALVLSIRTVENHVHRILTKLGVSTRTEATTLIRAWMAQHVR